MFMSLNGIFFGDCVAKEFSGNLHESPPVDLAIRTKSVLHQPHPARQGPKEAQPPRSPERPQKPRPSAGPPDLDELWRDFNRKLGGLFGGMKPGGR